MPLTFTNAEQTYIDNLRSGTPTTLGTLPALVPTLQQDFDNFRKFLIDRGQTNPQNRDLYLEVKRQNVVDLLQYAATNACLVLQTCFGFDQPINNGGQVQLIQKGNLWQQPGVNDDAIVFHTVFKRITGVGAAQRESYELFLGMDLTNHLPVEQARQYLKNFSDYYPGRTHDNNPFTLGYLLPVKALFTELTTGSLSQNDMLTFRWGISSYAPLALLGNFSLVIGTGDTSTGPIIAFRKTITGTSGTNMLPPCPPNPGCQL